MLIEKTRKLAVEVPAKGSLSEECDKIFFNLAPWGLRLTTPKLLKSFDER